METEISIVDHDRVTEYHAERSFFGYLYATLGATLILTMVMVVVVFWTSMAGAIAGEARVLRGPGEGYYDAKSLTGAAAVDIRAYMDRTWVECDDLKGHGRCNLNASTESIQLRYVEGFSASDAYAVAYLTYTTDTGNRPAVRLALWEKGLDGHYRMLAVTDELALVSNLSVSRSGTDFRISGLTEGPNDAFCCPTKKSTFDVTVADGRLKVSPVPEVPTPVASKSRKNTIALEGVAYLDVMKFAQPRKRFVPTGFDRTFSSYDGEPTLFFYHHDSEMAVVPRHGLIAYHQPNDSIGKIVREGDKLFEGHFGKSGIAGTAYVFKAGCPPVPYRVSGNAYDFEAEKLYRKVVLKGLAPVHARNSCAVVGTIDTGPNAVLVFEPAGAYAE